MSITTPYKKTGKEDVKASIRGQLATTSLNIEKEGSPKREAEVYSGRHSVLVEEKGNKNLMLNILKRKTQTPLPLILLHLHLQQIQINTKKKTLWQFLKNLLNLR